MTHNLRTLPWRKPRRSGSGPDSNCVEVASLNTIVAIRDSKLDADGESAFLTVPTTEWSALLAAIAE